MKNTPPKRFSQSHYGNPRKTRRKRLRAKSPKRKKWENLKLRREYMEANPWCELSYLFPRVGGKFVSVPGCGHVIRTDQPACDPHHIVSGILATPRWDLTTNLVALCRPVHEFCETYTSDGIALSLYWKHMKREMDLPKLDEITHVSVKGWLENQTLKFAFAEDCRRKLLEALT